MTIAAEKRTSADAVGGKMTRACDSCLRCRARWFCAADDAFLCQDCDSSVHSANPLARRHGRVRLKSASSSQLSSNKTASAPSWHQGFRRKPRTPRGHHAKKKHAAQLVASVAPAAKSDPLVPDSEATSLDENGEEEEQHLPYRVPIFDPLLAECCSGHVSEDSAATTSSEAGQGQLTSPVEAKPVAFANALPGFFPSDAGIGDFADDVESPLGRGLDEEGGFCMDGLRRLMEVGGDVVAGCSVGGNYANVKLETPEGDDYKDLDDLDLNLDHGSPVTEENLDEDDMNAAPDGLAAGTNRWAEAAAVQCGGAAMRRRVTLRLDYEAVIEAWLATHGCSSPWADGQRPRLNTDDWWPAYMGIWWEAQAAGVVLGTGSGAVGGDDGGTTGDGAGVVGGGGALGAGSDRGREARVSRYREKRRTRLFTKKIRYEVRKLNAEKRPRMKGRFVKIASFVVVSARTANAF